MKHLPQIPQLSVEPISLSDNSTSAHRHRIEVRWAHMSELSKYQEQKGGRVMRVYFSSLHENMVKYCRKEGEAFSLVQIFFVCIVRLYLIFALQQSFVDSSGGTGSDSYVCLSRGVRYCVEDRPKNASHVCMAEGCSPGLHLFNLFKDVPASRNQSPANPRRVLEEGNRVPRNLRR